MDFERLPYLGDSWDSSLTIEWITPGVREFAGSHPIAPDSSPLGEASLYLAEHHPIERWSGRISWDASASQCVFDYDVRFDFPGLDGDPVPGLRLTGRAPLQFDGFIIVPDNLAPKPASVEEAGGLLAEFFDAPGVAVDEGWRYVFRPS